ncbi:MAG TPA: hypothetical protein VJH05_00045 [Candidatus Paceibacterota bacterium]
MVKIISIFAIIPMFLVFSPSAFAAQGFDYYFGPIFVPLSTQINTSNTSQTVATLPIQNTGNNAPPTQIATMQANLNLIKANLALLNSSLVKSNSNNNEQVAVKSASQIAMVSRGIPLVLEEEKEKIEERGALSIFASLIPPDVKNFPLITTYLVVLTLTLLGIIVYLFFTRRQDKKRVI